MWHDSLMCVTWLIHICTMSCPRVYTCAAEIELDLRQGEKICIYQDSLIFDDMSCSHVWHVYSHVWHVSFVSSYVYNVLFIWILVCSRNRAGSERRRHHLIWHDSNTFFTWLSRFCDVCSRNRARSQRRRHRLIWQTNFYFLHDSIGFVMCLQPK